MQVRAGRQGNEGGVGGEGRGPTERRCDLARGILESILQYHMPLIPSPHLLVPPTNEQRVPTFVATNGSQWLK